MKSALGISLTFHLLITLIATQWVSFRQVKFVPRQVYAVDLVTAAEPEKEKTKAAPPPAVPDPQPPEQVEEKPDEMEPPPPKPLKKPRQKPEEKPKKTVPTTEIKKTLPENQPSEADESQGTPDTGEMAFDTDDFPFAHYIGRMRRKIAAYWRVPEGSQGSERFCRVYFRVLRDGSVVSTAVEESSGLYIFDQAAQRAVLQAAPMPPLPKEYREEYLGVHFSFSYSER